MTDEELEAAGDSGEDTAATEKTGFAAGVGKVFSTLTTIAIVALLGFMIYATVAAARGKIVSVFGRCLLTVITGSMEPTLHVGDFIFVEKTDPAALREGDIITFWSEQQDIYGMLVTHRIVSVTETGFVTRGDANPVDDSVEVAPGRILGRYTGKARLFRWASSFGDFRKLALLVVMISTTIAAFYEVRTIGGLKQKIDAEKQSKLDERERLIREAIEREKERLAAEGFSVAAAAVKMEEAESPAETEVSDNITAAKAAVNLVKAEDSDKKSSTEETEIPDKSENSAKETSTEKAENPAEIENSDKELSAEKAESPDKTENSAKMAESDKNSATEKAKTPAKKKKSNKRASANKAKNPAKPVESNKKLSAEKAESPAKAEISDKQSSAEKAESPAKTEISDKKLSAEKDESLAKAEISDKKSSAEKAEKPAETARSAENPAANETVKPAAKAQTGSKNNNSAGKPGGSKKKKKKRKKH